MRNPIAKAVALAIMVVSLGVAQGRNSSRPASPELQAASQYAIASKAKSKAKPYQVGTASWYGSDFDGKPTATGEPYNMYDMTAAHPALPLGSWVKVTNLRNGRVVVVRVNDRGPVVPGRIIDLSYSAARALEFKNKGLQRVRLDVVHPQLVAMARN